MLLLMKNLHAKGYICDATLQSHIRPCLEERSQQRQQMKQRGIDFDANPAILYTAMKVCAFIDWELITDEKAMREISIECNEIVMATNLDLMQNRTFLGKYKLQRLTRSI